MEVSSPATVTRPCGRDQVRVTTQALTVPVRATDRAIQVGAAATAKLQEVVSRNCDVMIVAGLQPRPPVQLGVRRAIQPEAASATVTASVNY